MKNQQQLKNYLASINVRTRGLEVFHRLEKGSLLSKSLVDFHEIDDPEIYKRLGNYSSTSLPYGPIRRALHTDAPGVRKVMIRCSSKEDEFNTTPFSKFLDWGVGECLEKAILLQLFAQNLWDSFLVSDGALVDETGLAGLHAFNIIFIKEQPYLVDVENPIGKKDGTLIHYIVPVLGMNKQEEFLVPKQFKFGRTYSLN